MSLARAIYDRWQAHGRLDALVPAERVFTGRASADAMPPYAIISAVSAQAATRTTHVAIDIARFQMTAWLEQHADAQCLLDELRTVYDRQSFVVDTGACLLMQCEEERIVAGDNSLWQAVALYRAWHQRAAPLPAA